MEPAKPIPFPRLAPQCLLVEDSDYDQKRIARILARGTRIELTIVSTIQLARSALSRRRFDLILLDNALPDGLGVNFALELSEDPDLAGIPIVMISDFPSPFIYDKAMRAGVRLVLGKDDFRPSHVDDALRYARVIAESKR
jgi:PleD family two-component response regulator